LHTSRTKHGCELLDAKLVSTTHNQVPPQSAPDTTIRNVPDANSENFHNLFSDADPSGLMPSAPNKQSVNAPDQDLVLTGVVGDFGSGSSAMFRIAEASGRCSQFTLREYEQNEWLEIRRIDLHKGIVHAVLKKPCIRIRSVGAEVMLSFKTHGQRNL
jgi:hypothetical protein